MPKPIIVGYDPGMTTAFAAIDLKGNLITAHGQREWASSAVAQAIREAGQPLIIAVDKRQASDSAEKFAARFGCKLWSPERDLGVDEKSEAVKALIKELAKNPNEAEPGFSVHEKDALAAAIFAYKSFAGQFSKIDDTLAQAGMAAYGDDVKRMVVAGGAKNLSEALDKIREKADKGKAVLKEAERPKLQAPTHSKPEQALTNKIRDLERSHGIQKMYIEKLESKARELERSNARLQEEQLKKSDSGRLQLLENKEVSLRENMISNLHVEIAELRKERERLLSEIRKKDERTAILEEGLVPLIPVAEWNREALSETDRTCKAKDSVLWIQSFSACNNAAKFCIALHPKAVAIECDDATERLLRNADITVMKGVRPSKREFYGAAGREELERAAKGGERASFLKWLRDYQRQ